MVDEQMISRTVEEVMKSLKAQQCKMTLELAKRLIEKVEEKAKEIHLSAVIAVSDEAGKIVAVHCMDGAFHASYDIAINKTYTASGLKMSTAELAKLSQPGQELYGIQHTNNGKIVIFGGGEPLEVEGKIIGALGVSGGTAKQDTMLATYGKEIFKEVILCR